MHYGQMLQSHAVHFFHLASPDLLLGFDSEPTRRNIVGVATDYPEIAKQGVFTAQIRPGGDPPHLGQAHPRHRRHSRRRQQGADGCRARRNAPRHRPDDRMGARRGAACSRSCIRPIRASTKLRRIPLQHDGFCRRRRRKWTFITAACAPVTPMAGPFSTMSITATYQDSAAGGGQALDLHEIPAHQDAGRGKGLVQGRAARPRAGLRPSYRSRWPRRSARTFMALGDGKPVAWHACCSIGRA